MKKKNENKILDELFRKWVSLKQEGMEKESIVVSKMIYIPCSVSYTTYDAWKTASKDDEYSEFEIAELLAFDDCNFEEFAKNQILANYVIPTNETMEELFDMFLPIFDDLFEEFQEEMKEKMVENYERI